MSINYDTPPKKAKEKYIMEKKKILNLVADYLSLTRSIIISCIIFITTILICILIYSKLNQKLVLVSPFEVPEEFIRNGFTGRVIANKFIDNLNYITENARTQMKPLKFSEEKDQVPLEFEVPAGSFSLEIFFEYLKEYFGRQQLRIIGEVTIQDDNLKVTTRVGGKFKSHSGQREHLESLLLESAKDTYKVTQPYILASFLRNTNENDSIEIIKHCINYEPDEDDPWAYNLWGNILRDKKVYEEAISKYQRSIEIDPRFPLPYSNWGNLLKSQEKYEEAINKFKKATDLSPSFMVYISWGKSLVNWGQTLESRGEILESEEKYKEAIDKYRRAIKLNKKDPLPYYLLGLSLEELNKQSEAITKYEKAIKLDRKGGISYEGAKKRLAELDENNYVN